MKRLIKREDSIFAALLVEREKYVDVSMSDYRFFHSYGEAFNYLSEKRQEYENGKDHRVGIYGEINCLKIGCRNTRKVSGNCFWFDQELRLVEVFTDWSKMKKEDAIYRFKDIGGDYPLPFQNGDKLKI